MKEVANMDRGELQRRGTTIRSRILQDFNWDTQAARIVDFFKVAMRARQNIKTA
jgi:hypothetical protein